MRDIKKLHPELQVIIEKLKLECSKQGLKIGISECLRTKEEQDNLYAQGRTKSGKIVTNAKGSTYSSMHQWGIAFDFYRNDGKGAYNTSDKFFEKVGAIGKKLGLEWGGNWKSIKDLPHFQLPQWGSTPSKLKQQYGTPENFFKSWNVKKKEDKKEDKKKESTNKSEYYQKCDSKYVSIIDALKSINVDYSFTSRKKIAVANGYVDYSGSGVENTALLNLLKKGKLKKA